MKNGERFGKEFLIPIGGKKLGKRTFHFDIGETFFNQGWMDLEVESAHAVLALEVEKQSAMLNLHFTFSGTVSMPCDRCGDTVNLELDDTYNLYAKFSDGGFETTEDVITIPDSASAIDIGPQTYEFLMLSIPMKKEHKKGECNKAALKRLNELNPEGKDAIDPRWKALKDLKQ